MERETGFEPATSTLARSHSTTELFPPGTKLKRTTRIPAKQDWPSSPARPRASAARITQHLRRLLRRRRIQIKPRRPLEAGHLRQRRDDLHVPVVEIPRRLGEQRAVDQQVV